MDKVGIECTFKCFYFSTVLISSVGFPPSWQSLFCMLSFGWYRIAWRSNSLLHIYILSLRVISRHFSQACCNTICLHVSWTLLPLSTASVFLPFWDFLDLNHKTNSYDKMYRTGGTTLHSVRKKRLITKRALLASVSEGLNLFFVPVPALCVTILSGIYLITKMNGHVLCGLTPSLLRHRHNLLWQNPKRRSVRVRGEEFSNLHSPNAHL